MSRDPRKLRVFKLADDLILEVYRVSSVFPPDERFVLQSQLRRAAEYLYFLNVATGSSAEARPTTLSVAASQQRTPDPRRPKPEPKGMNPEPEARSRPYPANRVISGVRLMTVLAI